MNEFMTEWDKLMETLHLPEHKFTIEEVEEIIKDYDFVPVVRCRDCKYMTNDPELGAYCTRWGDYFEYWEDSKPLDMNGFCHMGERRDEYADDSD